MNHLLRNNCSSTIMNFKSKLVPNFVIWYFQSFSVKKDIKGIKWLKCDSQICISFMRFQIWNMKHLFYRFIVVCNSSAVIGRERRLGNLILKMSMSPSVGFGILSLIYKNHVFTYLFCIGTLENFYFNIEHPFSFPVGGAAIKLSFFQHYID